MTITLNDQNQLVTGKAVQLRPYVPRQSLPYELMTDVEIQSSAGGLLTVDTELYANFFLILMKEIRSGKLIKFTHDDFNPAKLSWIMHSYTTVGFNYWRYDLPIIWKAFKNCDLSEIREVSNAVIFQNTWPSKLQTTFDFKIWPTKFVDMIELCPGQHSLKLYMGRLHSKRLQDLPFSPDTVLNDAQKEIVTDYCHNDIVGTQELFLFNRERIQLREELGREYKTNLLSKSDAQMAEAMIAREIYSITNKWPKKADLDRAYNFSYEPPSYLQFSTSQLQRLLNDVCNTEFKVRYGTLDPVEQFKGYYIQLGNLKFKFGIGGLHSCEESIAYTSSDSHLIIDRDVSSYYPRIITSLGLYPEHLGPVFLEVYAKMMEDRLIAKACKNFTKDKGLKIATNGISGKFNSEYSIVYSPKCYLQMTLTGQLSILMLCEMLHLQGLQLISANTDGVVIYCCKSRYETLASTFKSWEKLTYFKTEETAYKAYYARDVNAYFAVKLDGEVKVKGPYSEVGSQTGTILDNNPITLICSDAIKALLAHGVAIEETVQDCKDIRRFLTVRNVASPGAHKSGYYLGKVVRWYYAKNCYGTINYVKSNNKVPETDGAMPIQDLPDTLPSDINYDFYIAKTNEILYDIAYFKRAKQVEFF